MVCDCQVQTERALPFNTILVHILPRFLKEPTALRDSNITRGFVFESLVEQLEETVFFCVEVRSGSKSLSLSLPNSSPSTFTGSEGNTSFPCKGTEKRLIASSRLLADIFPSNRTYGILGWEMSNINKLRCFFYLAATKASSILSKNPVN